MFDQLGKQALRQARMLKVMVASGVVRPYNPGAWGPNQIHQLIAPFSWRLPFERQWRDPNASG